MDGKQQTTNGNDQGNGTPRWRSGLARHPAKEDIPERGTRKGEGEGPFDSAAFRPPARALLTATTTL